MNNGNEKMKGILLGFSLGFTAGAVTAMLLTTKTGEELRADIRRIASEIRDNVDEKASEVKEMTKQKYEEFVDEAISNYRKAKELTEKEVNFLKKILMDQKDIIK